MKKQSSKNNWFYIVEAKSGAFHFEGVVPQCLYLFPGTKAKKYFATAQDAGRAATRAGFVGPYNLITNFFDKSEV